MADETDRYAGVMGEALDEIESIGSTTPAPTADPVTPARLADRRKKIEAEHVKRRYFYGAECSCGECLPCVVLADELAWLDEVERLRAERDDAQRAAAVLQSAADEANRRITLARRTAADLHEFNSPDGEHLDGCPGCRLENELGEARPDPHLLALEEVAQRYPEAFAWHLANEQAKATRKDHTR